MPQAFLLLLLTCLPIFAQTRRVVAISDGDTIIAISNQKQLKVRLAGIDAPEKGQGYSDPAKQYLSSLILDETVRLEGSNSDRYSRLIAKVTHDGRDVGLMMIQNGFAWHFTTYAIDQSRRDRISYAKAQREAHRYWLNLWSNPDPIAPWDFRAGKFSPEGPQSAPPATPQSQPRDPVGTPDSALQIIGK